MGPGPFLARAWAEPPGPGTGARSLPTWPARPDPAPLTTVEYLDLDLRLAGGKISALKIRKGRFKKGPTRLPRYRGKYVVLLYSHAVLLDVLRFTFPLTGGAGKRAMIQLRLDQNLARGVTARTRVRVPFDSRVTRVLVRDMLASRDLELDLSLLRPSSLPFQPPNLRTSSFGSPQQQRVTAGKAGNKRRRQHRSKKKKKPR